MATEILRPNAAGDETDCVPSGATNNWECVDEETADDDSTFVYCITPYDRDLYNLPASSGSGTINFIKIYFRCYRGGTGGYANPVLKSDSTVTEGTQVSLVSTWTTYSEQWDTNPADGEAWEWSDIDDLQIGIGLYRGKCTQVYVEVDYGAGVTEKTSSDTGSGVDTVDSLETPEAKNSSDTGSGAEGTPLSSATLAGSETGSGIEALFARLLAAFDIGIGTEAGGLQYDKALSATELGEGADRLTAKIEIPAKGGGMKLWT